MQPKMLYMRKTPLSGGAILFLLSAGFVLFPTQWLGDLLTQDELLAQMLGLGIFRKAVRIGRLGAGRWYAVEDLP